MIKYDKRSVYRHEVEKILKERGVGLVKESQTLDILFGNYDNDYHTEFVVKNRYVIVKQTLLNRINSLWVYPLFILLMPIRYLLFGQAKVNVDSTLGRVLTKLIGEL